MTRFLDAVQARIAMERMERLETAAGRAATRHQPDTDTAVTPRPQRVYGTQPATREVAAEVDRLRNEGMLCTAIATRLSLTPRQVARHFKATGKRLAREEESRRFHTWHIAALPLQKKFPSFREFAKPASTSTPARRHQSGDEQIAAFKGLMDRRKRKP